MSKPRIRCPTCGAAAVRRVSRDVVARAGRRSITVASVELDECERCVERLYDLAALQRIAAARNALRPRKRVA